jgi:acetoacetyl-CoA synthetase
VTAASAPEVIRPVADDVLSTTEIGRFMRWLAQRRRLEFEDYAALHRWSVGDLEGFWSALAEFFGVRFAAQPERVLGRREMPGAVWFPGARLNYAEHAVGGDAEALAIVAYSQTRDRVELTWADLRDLVARARAGLRRLGVGRGDRVAAYLPNIPETVVAFLATAGLGAVWAACAPEFGPRSVVDRFAQIEPTVLLSVAGYGYGAKDIDRRNEVAEIRAGLPTVRHVVHVPYGPNGLPDALAWGDLLAEVGPREFEPVPFDHPLCVLFTSGTTGKPKAIVHGHGGILLEHLKNHALSWDLEAYAKLSLKK